MTNIHSCSYYCERPECIKAQRDELRERPGSMTDRELMQQPQRTHWEGCEEVHPECRKPEQEPVARVYLFEPNGRPRVAWDNANGIKIGDKLYTSPPQRKPLTDGEIMDNWLKVMWAVGDRNKLPIPEFARAIEAAHGIKENT